MASRNSQAFELPAVALGIPARTIVACGSLVLIASWEIASSRAYFLAVACEVVDPGLKYFFRLGSFQTCQDWIGSGAALRNPARGTSVAQ